MHEEREAVKERLLDVQSSVIEDLVQTACEIGEALRSRSDRLRHAVENARSLFSASPSAGDVVDAAQVRRTIDRCLDVMQRESDWMAKAALDLLPKEYLKQA